MGEMTAEQWARSYADPKRGLASFGGLNLEADSIYDSRWDRVLPLMTEEQLYLCAQVEDRLGPGLLVLDLGTGCGVFALWAARHRCRVVALDTSRRALWLAAHNARVNDIRTTTDRSELSDGVVCLLGEEFDQAWAGRDENREQFDLVFMNPPFTPTLEGAQPPSHAAGAGIDGQAVFRAQIADVPGILKPGGTCAGLQFGPVGSDGQPEFVQILQDAWEAASSRAQIRYSRPVVAVQRDRWPQRYAKAVTNGQGDIASDVFLEEVYQNGLHRPGVKAKITEFNRHKPFYGMFCYEATRAGDAHVVESIARVFEPLDDAGKPIGWEQRTWLHRQVIEHQALPAHIPLPSLLLERGFADSCPDYGRCEDDEALQRAWSRSPLRDVVRWVRYHHIAPTVEFDDLEACGGSEETLFDLLVVNAAPAYPKADGSLASVQSDWMAWYRAPGTDPSGDAATFLGYWEAAVAGLNTRWFGPFLHPGFREQRRGRPWPDVIWTPPRRLAEVEAPLEDAVRRLWRGDGPWLGAAIDIDAALTRWTEQERAEQPRYRLSARRPYAIAELGEILDYRTYQDTLAQYDLAFEGRTHTSTSSPDREERLSTDLRACVEVSHLALILASTDRGQPEQASQTWSTLLMLPFSPLFPEGDHRKHPEYFGSVFVFARSSRLWTPRHDAALRDLSTLLWVQYNALITREEQQERLQAERQRELDLQRAQTLLKVARGVGHAMKHPAMRLESLLKQTVRGKKNVALATGYLSDLTRSGHLLSLIDQASKHNLPPLMLLRDAEYTDAGTPILTEQGIRDALRQAVDYAPHMALDTEHADNRTLFLRRWHLGEAVFQVEWEPAGLGLAVRHEGAAGCVEARVLETALRALLWELILNAIKHHGPPGWALLKVSTASGQGELVIEAVNSAKPPPLPPPEGEGVKELAGGLALVRLLASELHWPIGPNESPTVQDGVFRVQITVPLCGN